jgi:hypothetical protein
METWCVLQLVRGEPARTLVLVVAIVIALAGGIWLHVGHAIVVR